MAEVEAEEVVKCWEGKVEKEEKKSVLSARIGIQRLQNSFFLCRHATQHFSFFTIAAVINERVAHFFAEQTLASYCLGWKEREYSFAVAHQHTEFMRMKREKWRVRDTVNLWWESRVELSGCVQKLKIEVHLWEVIEWSSEKERISNGSWKLFILPVARVCCQRTGTEHSSESRGGAVCPNRQQLSNSNNHNWQYRSDSAHSEHAVLDYQRRVMTCQTWRGGRELLSSQQ